MEGYPQHWRTGEESPLFVAANFPSLQADLLALHKVCSMPFTTLPFDLLANSDCMLTVGGRAADNFVLYGMIWYIRQLSHAYMLPSVSRKQFQSLLKFSQLTRGRLRPFSSRVLFVYAFYAFVYAFLKKNLDGASGFYLLVI